MYIKLISIYRNLDLLKKGLLWRTDKTLEDLYDKLIHTFLLSCSTFNSITSTTLAKLTL